MAHVTFRFAARTCIPIMLLVACSSTESSTNTQVDEARGIGGLSNYGYAGNVSYGGYSAFAGQPWGGANGNSGGNSSSTGAGTGGLNSSTGGNAVQATTTGGASGAGTGGRSSVTGGNASGGLNTGAGGASMGGRTTDVGGASTGGRSTSAGATATGGSRAAGGSSQTGGKSSTGGLSASGGSRLTGGATATGGNLATGGTSAAGGGSGFNWGTSTYNPTGGSAVNHQGHNTGAACLASCHSHNFQAGGTIYQTNGTSTAGNVQIGIIMNGTLFTGYSGTQGNFFFAVSGTLNWATAQVAIRTATGTAIHPATTGLSGNCNSCHNSTNRIVVP